MFGCLRRILRALKLIIHFVWSQFFELDILTILSRFKLSSYCFYTIFVYYRRTIPILFACRSHTVFVQLRRLPNSCRLNGLIR